MPKAQQTSRYRHRVVIVDDSRTMQAILHQILSIRMGFEIVGIAGDGKTALAMIEELKPDLVTIDLQMPYIDGRALLNELAEYPAVRKVVISSLAVGNIALKASLEELGADACIAKEDISRHPEKFSATLAAIVAKPGNGRRTSSGSIRSVGSSALEGVRVTSAQGYPVPTDEWRRLEILRELDLANDNFDEPLDLLARHLAQTTSFACSTITFIDRTTQWVKASVGFDRGASSRAQAFCAYTICGDEPLVVNDAVLDARFKDMECVVDGPIRSYVGCPIVNAAGIKLGAVCLVDSKPRGITSAELVNLRSIARIAAELLELRRALVRQAA